MHTVLSFTSQLPACLAGISSGQTGPQPTKAASDWSGSTAFFCGVSLTTEKLTLSSRSGCSRLVPVQRGGGLAETHVCGLVTLLCFLVRDEHCHWASFIIIIPIISFLVKPFTATQWGGSYVVLFWSDLRAAWKLVQVRQSAPHDPIQNTPPSSSSQVAAALQKNPKSSVSFFPMRCSSGSKNKSYDYKRLLVAWYEFSCSGRWIKKRGTVCFLKGHQSWMNGWCVSLCYRRSTTPEPLSCLCKANSWKIYVDSPSTPEVQVTEQHCLRVIPAIKTAYDELTRRQTCLHVCLSGAVPTLIIPNRLKTCLSVARCIGYVKKIKNKAWMPCLIVLAILSQLVWYVASYCYLTYLSFIWGWGG